MSSETRTSIFLIRFFGYIFATNMFVVYVESGMFAMKISPPPSHRLILNEWFDTNLFVYNTQISTSFPGFNCFPHFIIFEWRMPEITVNQCIPFPAFIFRLSFSSKYFERWLLSPICSACEKKTSFYQLQYGALSQESLFPPVLVHAPREPLSTSCGDCLKGASF